MKLFIASDLHGSAYYTKIMCELYKNEKADRLVLLGDLLYHGPRNDLPEGYAPKEVFAMLNELAEILAVRGNQTLEVDQMVLNFPMMADYMTMFLDGHLAYFGHGHLFSEEAPPALHKGDVLLHGHTHFRAMEKGEVYTRINPGSISLPKDGVRGYVIYENGKFTQKYKRRNSAFGACTLSRELQAVTAAERHYKNTVIMEPLYRRFKRLRYDTKRRCYCRLYIGRKR